MEPCIYNTTPDVGKEDPFHELYLAQSKEDRNGGMEEKIAVNLQCVLCFPAKIACKLGNWYTTLTILSSDDLPLHPLLTWENISLDHFSNI